MNKNNSNSKPEEKVEDQVKKLSVNDKTEDKAKSPEKK